MDGLKFTSLYYIKQNGVFVGGICLCICLFVRASARCHWSTWRHVTFLYLLLEKGFELPRARLNLFCLAIFACGLKATGWGFSRAV